MTTTAISKQEAVQPEPSGPAQVRWLRMLACYLVPVGCIIAMFFPVSPDIVAVLAVFAMLGLMGLRVPIAIAMLVPSIAGLYVLYGERAVAGQLGDAVYEGVAEWSFSVLPMFVLMGMLLWKSGLTDRIYEAANQWVGWLPGGLAVGTNFAGAGLASVSGSTVGTTYALARVGIPQMLRYGYDKRLAVAAVIVAGMPGQLIPPSVLLVLYAGIAESPVGPTLIAGVIPGLLVSALYALMILALCVARPSWGGRGPGQTRPATSWSRRFRSALSIWPLPFLLVIVIGGMYNGVLTATEAGAAGALGALILTLVYRRGDRPFGAVFDAARETVRSVGAIFLLILGALALSQLMAVSGLGGHLATWVIDMDLNRIEFLLMMTLVYLLLGTFMEPLPMMLLTVPLLIPVLAHLEISLLWYGVFVVFMGELAIVSPPVGILAFIVHEIAKDPEVNQGHSFSLSEVFRATYWFLPISVVIVLVLIFFPELATWLPDKMG